MNFIFGKLCYNYVSSLDPDYIYEQINHLFGTWNRDGKEISKVKYEKNRAETFVNLADKGGRYIIYPLDNLSRKELLALKYINTIFGEGTSSIL